jgi:hypothetical protein
VSLGLAALIAMSDGMLQLRAADSAIEVPIDWQTLENPGLGFTLQMPPGLLREGIRPLDTSLGELDMYVVGLDERDRVYAAIVADFPEFFEVIPSDTRFEGVTAGVLTNLRRRLRQDEQVSLAGYPGRVLFYEGQDGLIYEHHLYWVGSRLYQMMAAISADRPSEERSQFFEDAEPFFASFELTDPVY